VQCVVVDPHLPSRYPWPGISFALRADKSERGATAASNSAGGVTDFDDDRDFVHRRLACQWLLHFAHAAWRRRCRTTACDWTVRGILVVNGVGRRNAMDIGLLAIRIVVGLFLIGHGTQKLFGWFGGYGFVGTGRFFESLGYRPGPRTALLAAPAKLARARCSYSAS
jgi:hypothetical protein